MIDYHVKKTEKKTLQNYIETIETKLPLQVGNEIKEALKQILHLSTKRKISGRQLYRYASSLLGEEERKKRNIKLAKLIQALVAYGAIISDSEGDEIRLFTRLRIALVHYIVAMHLSASIINPDEWVKKMKNFLAEAIVDHSCQLAVLFHFSELKHAANNSIEMARYFSSESPIYSQENIGVALLRMGKPDEAKKCFSGVKEYYHKTRVKKGVAGIDAFIAWSEALIAWKKDNHALAQEKYTIASKLFGDAGYNKRARLLFLI